MSAEYDEVDLRVQKAHARMDAIHLAQRRVNDLHRTSPLTIEQREGVIAAERVLAERVAVESRCREEALESAKEPRAASLSMILRDLLGTLADPNNMPEDVQAFVTAQDRSEIATWVRESASKFGVRL